MRGRTAFSIVLGKNNARYNDVLRILANSSDDGRRWLQSANGREWQRLDSIDPTAPIPVSTIESEGAIDEAFKRGGENIQQIIRWVELGGNLEWRTPNGWTLLHHAALCGNEQMIEFLLRHKADIEARDNRKETPLILACDYGYGGDKSRSVVGLLLKHGANPNAVDCDGNTALGLIRQSGSNEAQQIAELLKVAGTRLVPGVNVECPECGSPYSAEMAKRSITVTFQGIYARFSCLRCDAQQQVEIQQIGRGTGANVRCSCGSVAHIPPSVWCKTCSGGLSSGWQQTLSRVQ